MTSRRAARRALLPCATVVAVLALAGCGQLTNPIQTDVAYQSSDGVPVDMGPVQIRGLVVVADAADGPGVLVGNLANDSGEAAVVSVAPTDGDPVTVEAPAYSSTSLSSEDQVTLPTVGAEPGDVITLQIGTRASGANVVQVPVLPAREYYSQYTPTATATTQPAG